MPVTLDEVRRIASLARLRPAPEEEESLARRMAEIVRFVGSMEAPAEGDPSGDPDTGVVREAEDELDPRSEGCLDREVVLSNAPDHRDGFVRLPPIERSGGVGSDGPAGEDRE